MKRWTVDDVMTRDVATVGPTAVGPSALPPGGSSAFTEAAGSAAANRLHRLLPGGMVVGV